MLKQFIIWTVQPFFTSGFGLGIFFILIVVYSQIFLYRREVKEKPPILVTILSGPPIYYGIQSMVAAFLLKEVSGAFILSFTIKVFIFLLGAFYIFLGIRLLKLRRWARIFILFAICFAAGFDFFVLLSTTHLKIENVFFIAGFYIFIFSIYYFGLKRKYFYKEEYNLSLQSDATKKKPRESFFDWNQLKDK